ncbi:MAG: SDR family oxidoreductase [Candidatus Hodarchaeota archaeon]
MGKATTIGLAEMNAHIVMLCRDKVRGESAQQEIIEITGNQNIDLFLCDLSSQQQIREFVAEFKQKYQKLHVLINNAGIMLSKRHTSVDGIEMNFAVNYLAPFLLSNLLLDVLKSSNPSRIINVSSGTHKNASIDFNDLQSSNKKYRAFKVYGISKLALTMFTYELSRKVKQFGITVNAVHPGVVNSNLGRDLSTFSQAFGRLFFKKPIKGAETSIYLASSLEIEGVTGKYFVKKQPINSSKESYNEDDAKKLWKISVNMTNL